MATSLITLEIRLFLAAAAFIVVFQMLTGRINMRGLLVDPGSRTFSAARLQMLLASVTVAFAYLSRLPDWHDFSSLPDIPTEQLVLLGGSHAIYLGGKGASLLGWFTSRPPDR